MQHNLPTPKEKEFWETLRGEVYPLDAAADWIENNLVPEDIFEVAILDNWATVNGYKKESE